MNLLSFKAVNAKVKILLKSNNLFYLFGYQIVSVVNLVFEV